MTEHWKDIVGYEGVYQVSDVGRVKTIIGTKCKQERLKSVTLRKDNGYYIVTLYRNNRGKTKYIHRVVLEAFVGPCPNDHECRHLDGIKIHNMLSNLVWGTRTENSQDTLKHGNHFQPDNRGSRHGESKLIESDIPRIRCLLKDGVAQSEVAIQFGVSQGLISRIKLRKNWRHVDG